MLWPRGAAIVGMYPYGGSIRGQGRGEWESEPTSTPSEQRHISIRPRLEQIQATFANPYTTLEAARNELTSLLNHDSPECEPFEAETAQEKGARNIPPGTASGSPPASTSLAGPSIALVAMFTGTVEQIRVGNIGDTLFSALSIEDAVARSIVHTPNLLRAADLPGVSYSNDELERFCDQLERSAKQHERSRQLSGPSADIVPPSRPVLPHSKTRRWKLSPKWLVPALIVLAVVGVYIARSLVRPNPVPPAPVLPPVSRTPSEIVIKMPIEAELFTSRAMFQTREELDRALTYGEGERFLPDTEQLVIMDSVSLAKGVYGYFKVDNAWRKGKLLQTLQPADTITIVKFLDPLP